MYNYFKNDEIVDDKDYMFETIKNFDIQNKYAFNSEYVVPTTYIIDKSNDLLNSYEMQFFKTQLEGKWVLKKSQGVLGQGIQLINAQTLNMKQKYDILSDPTRYVFQKYVENPLLINKKKFGIRSYAYIISAKPFIVLYSKGYIRKTLKDFDLSQNDTSIHITNIGQLGEQSRNETGMDFIQFEQFLENHHPQINATRIYDKMKAQISYAMEAFQQNLELKIGGFQFFGLDYLIDSDFNTYLLEINRNPQVTFYDQLHKDIVHRIQYTWLESSILMFDNRYDLDLLGKHNSFVCIYFKMHNLTCEILINEAANYYFLKNFEIQNDFISLWK